jgi:hypothetical protein
LTRFSVLNEAIQLTGGDRLEDYGDPVETHQRIADMFNAATGHRVTAQQVAIMHVCTKLARIATSPEKMDSYVDGAA